MKLKNSILATIFICTTFAACKKNSGECRKEFPTKITKIDKNGTTASIIKYRPDNTIESITDDNNVYTYTYNDNKVTTTMKKGAILKSTRVSIYNSQKMVTQYRYDYYKDNGALSFSDIGVLEYQNGTQLSKEVLSSTDADDGKTTVTTSSYTWNNGNPVSMVQTQSSPIFTFNFPTITFTYNTDKPAQTDLFQGQADLVIYGNAARTLKFKNQLQSFAIGNILVTYENQYDAAGKISVIKINDPRDGSTNADVTTYRYGCNE